MIMTNMRRTDIGYLHVLSCRMRKSKFFLLIIYYTSLMLMLLLVIKFNYSEFGLYLKITSGIMRSVICANNHGIFMMGSECPLQVQDRESFFLYMKRDKIKKEHVGNQSNLMLQPKATYYGA